MKRLCTVLVASALALLASCASQSSPSTPSQSIDGSLAASSKLLPPSAAAQLQQELRASKRHSTSTTTNHPHRTTTTASHPHRTTTTAPHSTTVPSTPSRSGVAGVVLSGKQCSTAPNPPTTRCGEQPSAARIKVLNSAGKVVRSGATSDHGSFVIPLDPGNYTLKATLAGGGSCPATAATVPTDQYVSVIIHCG
jgi:hypothetical protein